MKDRQQFTRRLPRRVATWTAAGAMTAAIGIAAAPAASANSVWDRVAECESGGNWSINTGNGFYGGLQFLQATWVGFGGQEFAQRADLASPDQQIAVAQRVLAVQGPGAWPTCSVVAGLTASNGGATPAPQPDPEPEPQPEPAPEPQPEPAPQPQPEPAPQPQPEPAPVQQAPAQEKAQVQQAPAQETAPAQESKRQLSEHLIQRGETTGIIADAHDTTVSDLVAINGLPGGGALIQAGDVMLVPGSAKKAGAGAITIQPGDTLTALAKTHSVNVSTLAEVNGIANPDLIIAGDTLRLG